MPASSDGFGTLVRRSTPNCRVALCVDSHRLRSALLHQQKQFGHHGRVEETQIVVREGHAMRDRTDDASQHLRADRGCRRCREAALEASSEALVSGASGQVTVGSALWPALLLRDVAWFMPGFDLHGALTTPRATGRASASTWKSVQVGRGRISHIAVDVLRIPTESGLTIVPGTNWTLCNLQWDRERETDLVKSCPDCRCRRTKIMKPLLTRERLGSRLHAPGSDPRGDAYRGRRVVMHLTSSEHNHVALRETWAPTLDHADVVELSALPPSGNRSRRNKLVHLRVGEPAMCGESDRPAKRTTYQSRCERCDHDVCNAAREVDGLWEAAGESVAVRFDERVLPLELIYGVQAGTLGLLRGPEWVASARPVDVADAVARLDACAATTGWRVHLRCTQLVDRDRDGDWWMASGRPTRTLCNKPVGDRSVTSGWAACSTCVDRAMTQIAHTWRYIVGNNAARVADHDAADMQVIGADDEVSAIRGVAAFYLSRFVYNFGDSEVAKLLVAGEEIQEALATDDPDFTAAMINAAMTANPNRS